MPIALFWWLQRFISPLLYFTSVLLLKQGQPFSIAWTVTSTVDFHHGLSYTKHSDLWIRFVLYIFDIIVFLMRSRDLSDFDLINVSDKYSP